MDDGKSTRILQQQRSFFYLNHQTCKIQSHFFISCFTCKLHSLTSKMEALLLLTVIFLHSLLFAYAGSKSKPHSHTGQLKPYSGHHLSYSISIEENELLERGKAVHRFHEFLLYIFNKCIALR